LAQRGSIEGTEEYNKFIKSAEQFDVKKTAQKLNEDAQEELQRLSSLLSSEDYVDINNEFERTKRNGNDKPWFSLSGPNSLADLASRLGCKGEYDIFYNIFSDIAHAQAFKKHIFIKNEE